jgi:hypothetical protein
MVFENLFIQGSLFHSFSFYFGRNNKYSYNQYMNFSYKKIHTFSYLVDILQNNCYIFLDFSYIFKERSFVKRSLHKKITTYSNVFLYNS